MEQTRKKQCRVLGQTDVTETDVEEIVPKGRYSHSLPERLAERYQEAKTDEDLVSLREEIALTDTRLADLLKRVDTGESGAGWRHLQNAVSQYRRASGAKEAEIKSQALETIFALTAAGVADSAAWTEIGLVMEQRRKLAESERKRLVAMGQMVTSERAMALLTSVVAAIKAHVHDPKTLAAISAEIDQMVTRG